jgi:hypothetical protein
MTCPADVLNNHRDLLVVEPGEELGDALVWGAEFSSGCAGAVTPNIVFGALRAQH